MALPGHASPRRGLQHRRLDRGREFERGLTGLRDFFADRCLRGGMLLCRSCRLRLSPSSMLPPGWHLSNSESKRILTGKAMRYTEAGSLDLLPEPQSAQVAAASPAGPSDLELQAGSEKQGVGLPGTFARRGCSSSGCHAVPCAAGSLILARYSSAPYVAGASLAAAAPVARAPDEP